MSRRTPASPQPAVKIVKDPENPQPIEIMEKAIVEVAEGARKLLGSKLTNRAVHILLRDATNESMATIERVLNAAARLDKDYLKAAVLFVAVAGLSACAGAQPKPVTARCNEQPQWVTKDAAGHDVGIYVCFGEENRLLYSARELPPPPPPAPAPALSADEKHFLEVGRAEVARMKALADKAAARSKKPAPPPAEAEEHHSLPTLTGTAK